jgi:hypothetical protein
MLQSQIHFAGMLFVYKQRHKAILMDGGVYRELIIQESPDFDIKYALIIDS